MKLDRLNGGDGKGVIIHLAKKRLTSMTGQNQQAGYVRGNTHKQDKSTPQAVKDFKLSVHYHLQGFHHKSFHVF